MGQLKLPQMAVQLGTAPRYNALESHHQPALILDHHAQVFIPANFNVESALKTLAEFPPPRPAFASRRVTVLQRSAGIAFPAGFW